MFNFEPILNCHFKQLSLTRELCKLCKLCVKIITKNCIGQFPTILTIFATKGLRVKWVKLGQKLISKLASKMIEGVFLALIKVMLIMCPGMPV